MGFKLDERRKSKEFNLFMTFDLINFKFREIMINMIGIYIVMKN